MTAHHPPSPAVQRQIAANRKRILDREAAVSRMITAAFQQAQRQIAPAQQHLLDAYATQLQRIRAQQAADAEDDGEDSSELPPPRVPPHWLASNHAARTLNSATFYALAAFALASRLAISDGQAQAAQSGAQDAAALITQVLTTSAAAAGASISVRDVPQTALDAFVGRSQTTGKPLATLLDGLGPATAKQVSDALMAALATGASPDAAARAIVNATGMAYSRASTISRTEMMGAYRASSLSTYRANADVLRGWLWLAASDACPFCTSMNGTLHDLGEDMESHPNCRCCPAPQTKSLDDASAME